MKALLDTHILLYWFEDKGRLSQEQRHALAEASAESPLFVSDITLWEIATLCNLGRITLDRPLRVWLKRATAAPLVDRVGISPADRIIVATAMVLGAILVTSDRRIRDAGLVPTL
jgi:PIN domain nuclease of toxin-antitoxin system